MATTLPATIPLRQRKKRFDPASLWLKYRKASHQLRLLAHWWLRPHTPFQPVFVLATHRSGSNLLVDYLNRLPEVASHSEVLCAQLPFGVWRQHERPDISLRHVAYTLQSLSGRVRGCKIMLDQLAYCELTVDTLEAAFPNSRYLILYRQSLAEQFLSMEAAKATKQWVLFDGEQRKQTQLYIDPAALRAYCDQIRRAYRDLLAAKWLPEQAVLLSYEELTAEPAWWLRERICPLLQTRFIEPQTSHRKQNLLPLAERVANYREVAALLASPLCRQHLEWPWQQTQRRAA